MSLWQRPYGASSIAANPSTQAGLNTQAAVAALQPATLVLTGITEIVVPHPQNPAVAFVCAVPPGTGLGQIGFDLVVGGIITTTNTTNVTLNLYSGNSLTIANDKSLGTSGAIAVGTTSAPFELRAHLLFDNTSGKLTGWFEGIANNTLIARAVISNVITGVKDSNNPVASFVVSALASAAAPANPATISIRNFTVG